MTNRGTKLVVPATQNTTLHYLATYHSYFRGWGGEGHSPLYVLVSKDIRDAPHCNRNRAVLDISDARHVFATIFNPMGDTGVPLRGSNSERAPAASQYLSQGTASTLMTGHISLPCTTYPEHAPVSLPIRTVGRHFRRILGPLVFLAFGVLRLLRFTNRSIYSSGYEGRFRECV